MYQYHVIARIGSYGFMIVLRNDLTLVSANAPDVRYTQTHTARTVSFRPACLHLCTVEPMPTCVRHAWAALRATRWPIAEERSNYWLDRLPIRSLLSDSHGQREAVRGWH